MPTAPQELSPTDAIKAASDALDKATTTSITLERQSDGNWIVTIAPAPAGGGAGAGGTGT